MEPEQQVSPKEPETKTPGVDGWEPPKDGTWVPTIRMKESVDMHKDRATLAEAEAKTEREARIRLEERLTAGETKKVESAGVTRAQLDQEVTGGRLTQAQADDMLMAQEKKSWLAEARQEFTQQREEDQQGRLIDDQIAAYTRACPEVQQQGSDERKKVTLAYNALVKDVGLPHGPSTELLALRESFGPADKLTELRSKRAAHSETSAGAGTDGTPTSSNLSGVAARQKAYTDKLVERGILTREDADKDLKFALGK